MSPRSSTPLTFSWGLFAVVGLVLIAIGSAAALIVAATRDGDDGSARAGRGVIGQPVTGDNFTFTVLEASCQSGRCEFGLLVENTGNVAMWWYDGDQTLLVGDRRYTNGTSTIPHREIQPGFSRTGTLRFRIPVDAVPTALELREVSTMGRQGSPAVIAFRSGTFDN